MSSQIAALHEHVEMLKERYLREVRREFRNTNNQRELTENGRRNMSRWERGGDLGDRDPYVFEREAREFQSTHFFMFPLRQSNYKNITHSYHNKITRKSTLECTLDHDENSNTNARTQVQASNV